MISTEDILELFKDYKSIREFVIHRKKNGRRIKTHRINARKEQPYETFAKFNYLGTQVEKMVLKKDVLNLYIVCGYGEERIKVGMGFSV